MRGPVAWRVHDSSHPCRRARHNDRGNRRRGNRLEDDWDADLRRVGTGLHAPFAAPIHLSQNGAPIQATGLRIKVSDDDLAIDEIEINAAQDAGNADLVFGTSLSTVVETAPPTSFAENDEEWIELTTAAPRRSI